MDIKTVIEQRLALQSTYKKLETEFQVENDINYIKSNMFLNVYSKWSESKKNQFIITLGGKVNFNLTKKFLENK